ncbi:MBL fold metallo-hydrolase [Siminovitchia sediminis]|uniref:MBL fold metallo-hydrolase n=1 Tax=Siminovitchia sediminis TaxID=1274353 RepID=A0ABW4KGV3_9BACI
MEWKQIPLGPLQTNCYLFFNEEKQCLVFDPGGENVRLIDYIEGEGFQPLAVLLTHAHFDHIGAVEDVRKRWDIPVYIHQEEREWLMDPALNGSARHPMAPVSGSPADHHIQEEGKLTIGPFEMEIFETPGHSPGSVSYYFKSMDTVLSGDALFNGGIGRTDLLGGDHDTLIQSIHHKLFVLPEHTVVLPGHGFSTTIGNEIESNPYV